MSTKLTSDWQSTLSQLSKTERKTRVIEAATPKPAPAEPPELDFKTAVGDVAPLPPTHRKSRPKPEKNIRVRPKETALPESARLYVGQGFDSETPPAQFSAGGQGRNDINKLLSRKFPVTSTLDLHGYQQEEAQEVLNEFIDHIQKRRGVVGEVIHGSGLGSRGFAPVLKTLVRRWLMAHPQVLAYTEPAPNNDGAVLVLLKRRPPEDPFSE